MTCFRIMGEIKSSDSGLLRISRGNSEYAPRLLRGDETNLALFLLPLYEWSMERFEHAGQGFVWVDIVGPSREELLALAQEFSLHSESVADCLEPGHLPKYEKFSGLDFLILRAFQEEKYSKLCTIESLSRKIALFVTDSLVITLRRKDHPLFSRLKAEAADLCQQGRGRFLAQILGEIALSYKSPTESGLIELEEMESQVFAEGRQAKGLRLRDVYALKRRVAMMKRLMKMNQPLTYALAKYFVGSAEPFFKDVEDKSESILQQCDELLENLIYLLSVSISIASHRTNEASQRTNEIMRVLTVISVVFMPLNFIVGIYGMNFDFMPELRWPFGYVYALGLLATVGLGILVFFRRRRWI